MCLYNCTISATFTIVLNFLSLEDDGMTEKERARQKAQDRIDKRRAESEKNKSPDILRAPVVVVLGHVDTGKEIEEDEVCYAVLGGSLNEWSFIFRLSHSILFKHFTLC